MKKKLGVAVIGINPEGIGNSHSRSAIANENTELVALCEINEEWAKNRSEFYGVPCCTDYHELLDREDIDIVVVCVPDHIHADVVCDFLKADKHVLCEKPLALNSADCKRMLDAEKNSKGLLMVGHVLRKAPVFMKAKQIVDEGLIGDITYIESEYAHNYSIMSPKQWRFSYETPRHSFIGGACHCVDLLRWLVGCNPTEIFAYGNHKLLGPEYGPCDDTVSSLIKFPNDIIGRVFLSIGCKSPGTGHRTVIYGTKGTLIMTSYDHYITMYLDEYDFKSREKICSNTKEPYTTPILIPVPIASHNTAGELEEFVDIIYNDKAVSISAREGADTVAVCEAGVLSTKTGKPEKIKYYE